MLSNASTEVTLVAQDQSHALGFPSRIPLNLTDQFVDRDKVRKLIENKNRCHDIDTLNFCRDYHTMDTLAAIVIMIATCATMFPLSVYSAKVLLQVILSFE